MVNKILLFLAVISIVSAQEKTDNITIFTTAVSFYDKGRLEDAYNLFSKLGAESDFTYRIPAEIFRGKILLSQNKLDAAEKLLDTLYKSVKDTTYRKEILLTRGVLLFHQNQFYESAEVLLELLAVAKKGEYADYAKGCLDTLALYKLTSDQLSILYDVSSKDVKPLLLLLYGKELLADGNRNEGRKIFQKLMKQYPSSQESKEAEDYYYDRKSVSKLKESEPVIAVLFPQTPGQGKNAASEIAEGIKFAVHEFNSRRSENIGLTFIDFKSENIKQIKNEILSSNTKCIIGPVFSEDVRLTLNEFRGIKIPIISPTATDNDLTGYNEFFFQANPNFSIRARAMANFIYFVENKRKIGILNAIEGYSPLLAADFSQEFRNLGGEIVISQSYKSGSGNFDDPAEKIAGAASDLEGIYVPISDKQDIIPLLSALSKNNLSVQMYGNQDWFIGKGYESYPMINNMVFTSDYFIDYNSYGYNTFNEEFYKVTGIDAERNVLYGYDLMKYFLNQLTKINAGPEIIADRMMNGNTVNGFHNNISFDEKRVNKFINLVRYRDGVFELVDKFKTSD